MCLGLAALIISINNVKIDERASRVKAINAQNRSNRVRLEVYIENQKFIKRINNDNN